MNAYNHRATRRQSELLRFIQDYIGAHRYPPTQREMAHALQCDLRSIQQLLNYLVAKNYISQDRGISRGIRIFRKLQSRNNGIS